MAFQEWEQTVGAVMEFFFYHISTQSRLIE